MDAEARGVMPDETCRRELKPNRKIFYFGLSVALFSAGFLSPLIGLLLIILHTAIGDDVLLGNVGTAFMIMSIPMLLLASHVVDLTESKK